MQLGYDTATDIAIAEYPYLHDYLVPEIKHNIDMLVDAIKSYDVKLLILDSTKTLCTVEVEQGRAIATYLAAGLMKTRIQKVVRLQSHKGTVEKRALDNVKHIQVTQALPFQCKFHQQIISKQMVANEHINCPARYNSC